MVISAATCTLCFSEPSLTPARLRWCVWSSASASNHCPTCDAGRPRCPHAGRTARHQRRIIDPWRCRRGQDRPGDGVARQATDQRQTTTYDPSDLEDRYETRLRALIDAKLRCEGIDVSEPAEPDRTNVVDLMAALKQSLAQEAAPKKAATFTCTGKAQARRCSGRQTGSEAGVGWNSLIRWPSLKVDRSSTFFEAYLTDKLLIICKVASNLSSYKNWERRSGRCMACGHIGPV